MLGAASLQFSCILTLISSSVSLWQKNLTNEFIHHQLRCDYRILGETKIFLKVGKMVTRNEGQTRGNARIFLSLSLSTSFRNLNDE